MSDALVKEVGTNKNKFSFISFFPINLFFKRFKNKGCFSKITLGVGVDRSLREVRMSVCIHILSIWILFTIGMLRICSCWDVLEFSVV